MSAKPKDIDIVFKPWAEWHALTEDLKEAKRLLRYTLEHERIDRGQIQQFLDRCSGNSREGGGNAV